MKRDNRQIIYLDEVNFTKLTFKNREWSGKNTNLTVDQKEIYTGYRSVIVAMTEEQGLIYSLVCAKAIDGETFIEFLHGLRRKIRQRPLAIFMDQLRVHKARIVMPSYDNLNIKPVFNIGYSPEFNPIEAVFSKVKSKYSRSRLNCLVNKIGFNSDREIRLALESVTQEHCSACVRKSFHLLIRAS